MNLLIVGATGLVGQMFINLLNKSDLYFNKIKLVSSNKGLNKAVIINGKVYRTKLFENIDLNKIDIACIFTQENISKIYVPILLKNNIKVIDNSSAFRDIYDLTIPELNYKKNNIYINPNCCIIQSIIPLFFINKLYKINNIIYNTYQSCSGGGYTLLNQLNNNEINTCIPAIGTIENDVTSEENKLINETKKLLNNNINVIANCVRVPTQIGHLVNIIFTSNCDNKQDILSILNTYTLYDEDCYNKDITNDHNIYTCRIKQISNNTFSFYTYSNNLLRGSSYNTFKILEKISIEYNM